MKLITSFIYFILQIFKKKHYQIIFYSPIHFNRGRNNQNKYFKELIDTCHKNKITYLFLEEPDAKSSYKRSENAVPFDFLFYLLIFFFLLLVQLQIQLYQIYF